MANNKFETYFTNNTVNALKQAGAELKTIDTCLTEISKTCDQLSKSDLADMADAAFEIADKYGKSAAAYLAAVQSAAEAGYQNAEDIASLSLSAQNAGNMTAELANQYILTTDNAYNLSGSIERLREILDGSNEITNHNAVNMTQLAEGMSIVGSTAASLGVEVDEITAALGTMIAATGQNGSEAASALKSILLNISQIADEAEGINGEGLARYESACNALNVSLRETRDGVIALRDPMEVLRDLSMEYNQLDNADTRKTDLLRSVGGGSRAAQLDALLSQWDTYETMLQQYADGSGSMAAEAEKTAASLEGSLNRLKNTWVDTVANVADSDAVIALINNLNGLLSVVNNITEALGPLASIGLGAGLFSGLKNVGRDKMLSLKNHCFELPTIICVL